MRLVGERLAGSQDRELPWKRKQPQRWFNVGQMEQSEGLMLEGQGWLLAEVPGSCGREQPALIFCACAKSCKGSLWVRQGDVKQLHLGLRYLRRNQVVTLPLHPLGSSRAADPSSPCFRSALALPWPSPMSHLGWHQSGARAAQGCHQLIGPCYV